MAGAWPSSCPDTISASERSTTLPLVYGGRDAGCGYVADFLVEGAVIVEVKSVRRLEPVFTAQMLTYLKLSGCRVGLLLNFNVEDMRYGIKRVARGFRES